MRTLTRRTRLTNRYRPSKLTLVSYSKTGRCRIVKRTMDDEADRCKFPVAMDQFPVRAKKFRVPNRTGNLPQRIGIAERIDASLAEKGSKTGNSRTAADPAAADRLMRLARRITAAGNSRCRAAPPGGARRR